MRVLYLSQFYPPEIGATQSRARAMARGLVRAGHRVTVITEFPNHPVGVIPAHYRGRWIERKTEDGVDVIRVRVRARAEPRVMDRLGLYLSYAFMATLVGLFGGRGRFDVLLATSPPLFVGATAIALSFLRRIPLVFEVRDLWPESAVQLGELREGRATRMASRLERACYRRARRIVGVTRGIHDALVARTGKPEKVVFIPNGADTELFRPVARKAELRERLGFAPDDFVVAYTGLHGLAHGLETVIDAAERLRDEPRIRFLLVGDGPRKRRLEELARERGVDNVRFEDSVPESELPEWLAIADAGLDVRRCLPVTRGTLPVKMFSSMACELPVILAIEGEAAELVREAEAGLIVPPEDSAALAKAVRALARDPERCRAMGRRGRALVVAEYSRAALAVRMEAVLREVLEEGGNP